MGVPHAFPELSNSGCRPGRAGGAPPLTLASADSPRFRWRHRRYRIARGTNMPSIYSLLWRRSASAKIAKVFARSQRSTHRSLLLRLESAKTCRPRNRCMSGPQVQSVSLDSMRHRWQRPLPKTFQRRKIDKRHHQQQTRRFCLLHIPNMALHEVHGNHRCMCILSRHRCQTKSTNLLDRSGKCC